MAASRTIQRVIITATCINSSVDPKRACVCVRNKDEECEPCECGPLVPTPPPTPGPPTHPPTPWFKLNGTVDFRVEIASDEYPHETTWEVKNECSGAVVSTGGPYATPGVQIEEFSLDTAQYTFTIRDSEGDGLCCRYGLGNYKVILDDEHEVAACSSNEECAFGAEAAHTFGSCDGPAPPTTRRPNPPAPTESPTKKPTPVRNCSSWRPLSRVPFPPTLSPPPSARSCPLLPSSIYAKLRSGLHPAQLSPPCRTSWFPSAFRLSLKGQSRPSPSASRTCVTRFRDSYLTTGASPSLGQTCASMLQILSRSPLEGPRISSAPTPAAFSRRARDFWWPNTLSTIPVTSPAQR